MASYRLANVADSHKYASADNLADEDYKKQRELRSPGKVYESYPKI
jgi:hypothetical protein